MRLIDADALSLKIHHGIYVGQITGKLRAMVLKEDIDAAPTIEAEPVKTGKWIDHPQFGSQCSECGLAMFEITGTQYCDFKPNYCPNCGAKMGNPE